MQTERRQDLIDATLDSVCEVGLHATTVRQVAERAGVTNGLIRHYFETKDQMIQEAYRATMADMTAKSLAATEKARDPAMRLRLFITANLTPPIVNARTLSIWASFISLIQVSQAMAEIHRDGYIRFRTILQRLVAEALTSAGRPASADESERLAIKINALIDGLWLEGCLAGDELFYSALPQIGIETVETILAVKLQEDVHALRIDH